MNEADRLPGFFLVVVILSGLAAAVALVSPGEPSMRPGTEPQSGTSVSALAESGCTGCHMASTEPRPIHRAPSLDGVSARAAARVASPDYTGTAVDADGYLLEALLDHCTDQLPGYECSEVPLYGNWLSLEDAYRLVDEMARGG